MGGWGLVGLLALALLVGLSLGLLGGGGAILTVPIFTYVAGMAPHEAGGSSLVVVVTAAVFGAALRFGTGTLRWPVAVVVGACGIPGAIAGQAVGRLMPGGLLLLIFAAVMAVSGVLMLYPRRDARATNSDVVHPRGVEWVRLVVIGAGVGFLTGLVGAGGGFVIVPALVILAGMSMSSAVATSLVIITMNAVTGLVGYLSTDALHWGIVLPTAAAAIVGSAMGARLTNRISPAALRKGFGVLVLAMAAIIVGSQAMA